MGFLDWLKPKKKEEPEKRNLEISRETIPEELKKLHAKEILPVIKKANKILDSCEKQAQEVKSYAQQISSLKVSKEVDKRLLVRLESARKNLVNRTVA